MFVIVQVVMRGAVIFRVKFIVPVVILLALSFTTTCTTYVHSPLHVTVGFCVVSELKVIVPPVGHDNFDRKNHEIHDMSPVVVMFISVHVFVIMSAGIVSRGAVLSILYDPVAIVLLPALSSTHAYHVNVPSQLKVGAVDVHQLQLPLNCMSVLYCTNHDNHAKMSLAVVIAVISTFFHAVAEALLKDNDGTVLSIVK